MLCQGLKWDIFCSTEISLTRNPSSVYHWFTLVTARINTGPSAASPLPKPHLLLIILTTGQSNLTRGRIAAAHGQYSGIDGTFVSLFCTCIWNYTGDWMQPLSFNSHMPLVHFSNRMPICTHRHLLLNRSGLVLASESRFNGSNVPFIRVQLWIK